LLGSGPTIEPIRSGDQELQRAQPEVVP